MITLTRSKTNIDNMLAGLIPVNRQGIRSKEKYRYMDIPGTTYFCLKEGKEEYYGEEISKMDDVDGKNTILG